MFACLALYSVCASAQERGPDASTHFRRGVELYNEANYEAALVEFQRAYVLVPTAVTLFDIGQAQFELQDYAGALKTFQIFLDKFEDDAVHRAEVTTNLGILRSRVGSIRITSAPPGADVAVDDVFAGTTPLAQPVLVSVGHRKVTASMSGRPTVVRYVDVAAEDEIPVTLPFLQPSPLPPPQPSETRPSHPAEPSIKAATVGWVVTGVLAAGAGVLGGLAIAEAHSLDDARRAYPASPTTLRHDANLTSVYSAVADGLGAAAIVAGGLSLYWTLSASHSKGGTQAELVRFGPASIAFEARF